MKARMFVVNEKTLDDAIKQKVASVRIPLDKDKKKKKDRGKDEKKPSANFVLSTDSLLADMMQIEPGDYIFFWCEKTQSASKSHIYGVFRAVSEAYYKFDDNDDIAPFKVKIEEAYHFDKPISEYEVLNSPYNTDLLWNINGKKVCGKSRGSIPISNKELNVLINMLIAKNDNYSYFPPDESRYLRLPCITPDGERIPKKLEISYEFGEKSTAPETNKIYEYDMYAFNHFDKKGKMYFEKTFEAMFNYEIKERNNLFFKQLDIDVNKIIWFANYLPYSLDKTEMDYLIFESEDGYTFSKAYVIEFKIGKLNSVSDDTHFYRSILYSSWVNKNLLNGSNVTRPIVICEKCPDFMSPKDEKEQDFINEYISFEINNASEDTKQVEIYEFCLDDGKPLFTRKK